MQFHRAMEPVFARLGVQLRTYNFGHGGLGTTQDALGMGSLWGQEIDVCMWDSGWTEPNRAHYDLFSRQAIISGNRVPVLWNGFEEILEVLHNAADVDIGGLGSGLFGLPITESEQHAVKLPFAVRYLKCHPESKYLCDNNKYIGRCWVDRPDVTPLSLQQDMPDGAAWHHPGARWHQLIGRVLAFTILTALQEALRQWKHFPNFRLPDSSWHVSKYYQNIRKKLADLTNSVCFHDRSMPSPRVCKIPMKAVSEFTPRAFPSLTSIRSIMIDTSHLPTPTGIYYQGPDEYDPTLEPPAADKGAINYWAIVENGENDEASSIRKRQRHSRFLVKCRNQPYQNISTESQSSEPNEVVNPPREMARSSNCWITSTSANNSNIRSSRKTGLHIGRGWAPHVVDGDIYCNGTFYSDECGRGPNNTCLLSGQNNKRGGLVFDSFSGWLLLQLRGVNDGLIIVKVETWQHPELAMYGPESNEITNGWTTEDNNDAINARRNLSSHEKEYLNVVPAKMKMDKLRNRKLAKKKAKASPELCPEFKFDYAINGLIETLNRTEFLRKKIFVQQSVETLTLLDDSNFSVGSKRDQKDKVDVDVELGIRMRGCERINTFKLTHVYWA